jgi:O-antigen/teichoic acid export membrane protein
MIVTVKVFGAALGFASGRIGQIVMVCWVAVRAKVIVPFLYPP